MLPVHEVLLKLCAGTKWHVHVFVICDRIREGTKSLKTVRFLLRVMSTLVNHQIFSHIRTMMSYLTHGHISQRSEGHEWSYDTEKLVANATYTVHYWSRRH